MNINTNKKSSVNYELFDEKLFDLKKEIKGTSYLESKREELDLSPQFSISSQTEPIAAHRPSIGLNKYKPSDTPQNIKDQIFKNLKRKDSDNQAYGI